MCTMAQKEKGRMCTMSKSAELCRLLALLCCLCLWSDSNRSFAANQKNVSIHYTYSVRFVVSSPIIQSINQSLIISDFLD